MKINYLTTNTLKFSVADHFFEPLSAYELVRHSFHVPEVQDSSCEEVARQSAAYAATTLGEACVVTDAGFSIAALNGFPGPFVKYINEWLSEDRILQMLNDEDDRSAYFIDALAIGFPDGAAKVFTHKTMGQIAKAGEYTPSVWPMNSLFIPNGYTAPLGSMSSQQQTEFWSSENQNWVSLVSYLTEKVT